MNENEDEDEGDGDEESQPAYSLNKLSRALSPSEMDEGKDAPLSGREGLRRSTRSRRALADVQDDEEQEHNDISELRRSTRGTRGLATQQNVEEETQQSHSEPEQGEDAETKSHSVQADDAAVPAQATRGSRARKVAELSTVEKSESVETPAGTETETLQESQQPTTTRKSKRKPVPAYTANSEEVAHVQQDEAPAELGDQPMSEPEMSSSAAGPADAPMSLAEFGSKVDLPSASDTGSKGSKSSSSSSPWKGIGGSIRTLKEGLKRVGSLRTGSPKKDAPRLTAGGKRRRDDEYALEGSDAAISSKPVESPADEERMDIDSAEPKAATPVKRVIRPRPSRAPVASPLSPSTASGGLYPDLSGFSVHSPEPQPDVGASPSTASSAQFTTAAASVLAEMNARLAKAGRGPSTIPIPAAGSAAAIAAANAAKGKKAPSPIPASALRFEQQHAKQFGKMDSIANHYAAQRNSVNGASSIGSRSSGTSNVRAPAKAPSLAPSLADRSTKRLKLSIGGPAEIATGSPAAAPSAPGASTRSTSSAGSQPSIVPRLNAKAEAQREANRRKLELARERRRSGAAPPLAQTKKGVAGRLMNRSGAALRGAMAAVRGIGNNQPKAVMSSSSTSTALSADKATPALAPRAKKKAVFDIKASLARKPTGYKPYSGREALAGITNPPIGGSTSTASLAVASAKMSSSATTNSLAARLRGEGWTGANSKTAAASALSPAAERTALRPHGTAGNAAPATMANSSQEKESTSKGAQPAPAKAGPALTSARRPRIQPGRVLDKKRQAMGRAPSSTAVARKSMPVARSAPSQLATGTDKRAAEVMRAARMSEVRARRKTAALSPNGVGAGAGAGKRVRPSAFGTAATTPGAGRGSPSKRPAAESLDPAGRGQGGLRELHEEEDHPRELHAVV